MPRQWFKDWRLLLALGGGAGLAPRAPGAAGTAAAALLFYLAAWWLPPPLLALLAVIMLAAGAPLCAHAERVLAKPDDGRIVWDEIAAFFAVLALIPQQWRWHLAAFVLFRLLDMLKPFPISWIDKKIKGGLGIMADDIAAALLTLALLYTGAMFF